MKLSTFAFLSIVPALCGAEDVPSPTVGATDSLASSSARPDALAPGGNTLGDLNYHVSPGIWTFELDKDIMDDSAIFAQVEAAFIQAANEAHDLNSVRFQGVRIKQVIHEEVGDDDDDDDEESLAHDAVGEILSPQVSGRGEESFLRRWRPSRRSNTRILRWRNLHRATVSYGCNLCRNDDDALMSTGELLTNDYYLTADGRKTLGKWERGFCKKLAKITSMKHPNRCFISMDFDHEEPFEEFLAAAVDAGAPAPVEASDIEN